jgi:plastocyanin
MYKLIGAAGLAAMILGASGCSNSGYGNSPATVPTGPTQTAPQPADAVTIDVVGVNGTQSFSPNPSTVTAGRMVVWHNVDNTTHRVVFDDGEVDTGNIAPGGFSGPTELVAPGPYHCSIHPTMVGTVTSGK